MLFSWYYVIPSFSNKMAVLLIIQSWSDKFQVISTENVNKSLAQSIMLLGHLT